jgi:HSP20 family protein
MLMTRWEPFARNVSNVWSELNRFRTEMDRLFESYGLQNGGWPGLTVSYPAVNVWQDGDNLYAEAELPGLDLNDLEIYVTGGDQLILKGERKQPQLDKGVWHRQERGFGTFTRSIVLPVPVDADRIEARFSNGVLTVTLPKAEAAKPRRIAVKSE